MFSGRPESCQQLASLFHDGHVGGIYGVEDIIETDLLQRGYQFAGGLLNSVQSHLLAPGDTYSRSELDHDHFLGIRKRIQHGLCIVPLLQSADRTVGDALTAKRAVDDVHALSLAYTDSCTVRGAYHFPYIQVLDLVADLDAAHAFDAFGSGPPQGEVPQPVVLIRNVIVFR